MHLPNFNKSDEPSYENSKTVVESTDHIILPFAQCNGVQEHVVEHIDEEIVVGMPDFKQEVEVVVAKTGQEVV